MLHPTRSHPGFALTSYKCHAAPEASCWLISIQNMHVCNRHLNRHINMQEEGLL